MSSIIGLLYLVGTATTTAVAIAPMPPVEVVCRCEAESPKVAVEAPIIIIAEDGDIGLSFRFGGLANLAFDGDTRVVSNFPVTQVGLKIVTSREVHFPISVGLGYRDIPDGGGRDDAVVGFDINAGIEYHFRIWRRIAPYAGLTLGVGYTDIENETLVGFGIGPVIGIEYYVADRVSLGAEYGFSFQIAKLTGEDATLVNLGTLAGGQAHVTVYF